MSTTGNGFNFPMYVRICCLWRQAWQMMTWLRFTGSLKVFLMPQLQQLTTRPSSLT
jgi:hypothetical protein